MSAPNPRCDRCRGEGVLVRPAGTRARATLCDCIPACEQCGGSGRLLVRLDGVERLARCRCRRLPDRIDIFNRAGVPGRHAHASFATFDKDIPGAMQGFLAAWRWAENYTAGARYRGLVFHGAVGRGKTHLLVAIVRHLVFQRGARVRFAEFSHLLAALKEGFDAGRGTAAVLGPLVDVEVLVIDELGKGRNTAWELSVIDELVSRRYNAMGTTLGATNYVPGPPTGIEAPDLARPGGPAPSLADRIGERVYSRLCEMVEFRELAGVDHRVLAR